MPLAPTDPSTLSGKFSVSNGLETFTSCSLEIAPPFYRPGAFAGPAIAGAGQFFLPTQGRRSP